MLRYVYYSLKSSRAKRYLSALLQRKLYILRPGERDISTPFKFKLFLALFYCVKSSRGKGDESSQKATIPFFFLSKIPSISLRSLTVV